MEERDVASMYSVKAWQKPKTENIVKQLDTSTSKIDEKLKPLLAAIAKLLVGATYDIHGDVTDQKYRYILDTMIVRVRAALTDKLSLYSENYSSEISLCIEEFNKHNVNQYKDIDSRINDILSTTHKDKDEILKTIINAIKNSKDSEKLHKKNLLDVLSMFEKKQKHDTISKLIALSNIKSVNILQKICKQTKLLEKRQQQISKASIKNFKMTNLAVKNNISSLDSKIKDQFSIVNSQIDSVNDTISNLSTGSFLSDMFSGITNFLMSPLKSIIHGIFATGKWLLKIPIAILDHVIFRPLKSIFSFILKPFVLGFKTLEDFITNQFKAIKDTLFDTVKSIFTNPIGIAFLAFVISFVWNRWLKPIFEPIWNHAIDWFNRTVQSVSFILQPFLDWLENKRSFKDAFAESWNRLISELTEWLNGCMNKIKEWIFGEDAYEHDKDGNRIKDEKGFDKTKSTFTLLIDKIIPKFDSFLDKPLPEWLLPNPKDENSLYSWAVKISNMVSGSVIPWEKIPGFQKPENPPNVATGKTLVGAIVGTLAAILFIPIITSIASLGLLIANLAVNTTSLATNIANIICGVFNKSSWFTGITAAAKAFGSGIGSFVKNVGTNFGAAAPALAVAAGSIDVFSGMTQDAQRQKDYIDGKVSGDTKLKVGDIPIVRQITSAADFIFRTNLSMKDTFLDYETLYGRNKKLYEKQIEARKRGVVDLFTRVLQDANDVKTGLGIESAILNLEADFKAAKNGKDILISNSLLEFALKISSHDVARLIDRNGKITNQLSVDLITKYISTLSLEQAKILVDEVNDYNKRTPNGHKIVLPKLVIDEINAREKDKHSKGLDYVNVHNNTDERLKKLLESTAQPKSPKIIPNENEALLDAVNESLVLAKEEKTENDKKLVSTLQETISNGNFTLINVMQLLVDGQKILLSRSKELSHSNSYFMVANNTTQQGYNLTYQDSH